MDLPGTAPPLLPHPACMGGREGRGPCWAGQRPKAQQKAGLRSATAWTMVEARAFTGATQAPHPQRSLVQGGGALVSKALFRQPQRCAVQLAKTPLLEIVADLLVGWVGGWEKSRFQAGQGQQGCCCTGWARAQRDHGTAVPYGNTGKTSRTTTMKSG